MRNYKEHFVAFLDILGFKNIIANFGCEDVYKIFNEIHSKAKTRLNFNGVEIHAYEHIKHKILSDSIIVFIDAEIEDSFAALLDVCSKLQRNLMCREEPILLRGGISKGLLYYEDDIIYGEALTNAYLLENNLAKYPRIIFTGKTLEEGRNVCEYIYMDSHCMLDTFSLDEDSLYFVHYLPRLMQGLEKTKEHYDLIFNKCAYILNTETNSNVREKYIWLKNYLHKTILCFPQIKDLYDKEQQEKFKKETDEYNKHHFSKFVKNKIIEL